MQKEKKPLKYYFIFYTQSLIFYYKMCKEHLFYSAMLTKHTNIVIRSGGIMESKIQMRTFLYSICVNNLLLLGM